MPRLQIHDYLSVRQFVLSEPRTIKFRQSIKDTNGTPFLVWKGQMEKTYIKTYKKVYIDRPDRHYEMDYTKDFETQFCHLQLIEDYSPQYIDPE